MAEMNTEQIAQATLANDPIEIRRMYEERIRRQQQQHQQDVEHLEELCLVRLRDQQRENEERLGYVEQGCLARIRAERRRVEQECEQRIQEERRRAEPKIGPGPREQMMMLDNKRAIESEPVFEVECGVVLINIRKSIDDTLNSLDQVLRDRGIIIVNIVKRDTNRGLFFTLNIRLGLNFEIDGDFLDKNSKGKKLIEILLRGDRTMVEVHSEVQYRFAQIRKIRGGKSKKNKQKNKKSKRNKN
jgi:hypothetical protein